MKVGLIVGSLRKESWNKKIAQTAQTLFPKEIETQIVDISKLPLYNPDLEGKSEGQEYENIRQEIKKYDGFIFFTPEYNRSYAPAIKNVIDVVSKNPNGNLWEKKPAAVFSASTGGYGAMAANHALRQSFVYVDLITMQQPEIYLSKVDTLFDENGKIVEKTRKFLEKGILAFVDHLKLITSKE